LNTYSPEETFILKKLEKNLPANLTYHGLHHTIDVFNAAMKIAEAENLSSNDMRLLRIAILYHDAGFTLAYKNHEDEGCKMAKKDLPAYGYSAKEISIICGMIMATKIPQNPHTILEKIICDADLDYLGRDDFEKISNTLHEEMKIYTQLHDKNEWYKIQKDFLEKHEYYTDFSRNNREHKKQKYLAEINRIISSFS
jgi:uncharacterized protein